MLIKLFSRLYLYFPESFGLSLLVSFGLWPLILFADAVSPCLTNPALTFETVSLEHSHSIIFHFFVTEAPGNRASSVWHFWDFLKLSSMDAHVHEPPVYLNNWYHLLWKLLKATFQSPFLIVCLFARPPTWLVDSFPQQLCLLDDQSMQPLIVCHFWVHSYKESYFESPSTMYLI